MPAPVRVLDPPLDLEADDRRRTVAVAGSVDGEDPEDMAPGPEVTKSQRRATAPEGVPVELAAEGRVGLGRAEAEDVDRWVATQDPHGEPRVRWNDTCRTHGRRSR
jgi:hypothetical protein